MPAEERVPIAGEEGIIAARQVAREAARAVGFGVVDQSRIATAVSELARNIVRYATGSRGEMLVRPIVGSPRGTGIEIVVADDGPGIPDVDRALQDGYTTGSGLGLGLPGARRLVDEMTIESVLGKGTRVTIRKWRR